MAIKPVRAATTVTPAPKRPGAGESKPKRVPKAVDIDDEDEDLVIDEPKLKKERRPKAEEQTTERRTRTSRQPKEEQTTERRTRTSRQPKEEQTTSSSRNSAEAARIKELEREVRDLTRSLDREVKTLNREAAKDVKYFEKMIAGLEKRLVKLGG